jgi:hypothetical protein
MKIVFTIIIALCATIALNAQSAFHTSLSAALATDNTASANATTFVKQASANGVLFFANSNGSAKRLVITNSDTNEVLISNVMEISTAFSTEKQQGLELASIAIERVGLEIEN